MKRVKGVVWKYPNSKERGMTWAAELRAGNALLCVYGQKRVKSAIAFANKCAKRLGWEMSEPWENLTDGKLIRSMVGKNRRYLRRGA